MELKYLIFLSLLRICLGGNVLILHPIFAGSHVEVLRQFGEHLVQRGHKVTQVMYKERGQSEKVDSVVEVMNLPIKTESKFCETYFSQDGGNTSALKE